MVNHIKPIQIRKALELTWVSLILQRTVQVLPVVYLQNIYFAEDDMIRSIYRFHVVFQTRKNSEYPRSKALPYINEFDPFKSRYNLESYRKLCNDFDVESNDWLAIQVRWKEVHSRWENRALCDVQILLMGWIQDHSCGLTQIGVQKLSESVRAYMFLTLSSQTNARSSIIGKRWKSSWCCKVYGVHRLNSLWNQQ